MGEAVAPEEFPSSLFYGVLATFIYEGTKTSAPGGIVTAYSADARHGFVYVAMASLGDQSSGYKRAAQSVEAFRLFVDFIFQGWPFRKIYLECPEYNVAQFGSFANQLRPEACLRGHVWMAGKFWDHLTFAILRDEWPELRNLGQRDG